MARNSIKSKKSYSSAMIHLQNFLNQNQQKYLGHDCETILQALLENKFSVYDLLDDFVFYILSTKPNITPKSVTLYLAALRSYFGYYDIDVIPSKFRRKVKVPKIYREDEQALDVNDIRKILLKCNNRRFKAYLLVLASSGVRVVEGLAIRLKDIDFSVSPTKIHIRKEYTKTKAARDIYISDEATEYLKQWLDWKYNNEERPRASNQEDLVFTLRKGSTPTTVYIKIWLEFKKLLEVSDLAERKEEGIYKRRKITLHSFRRFVKTVISNQVGQDFSELILGHNNKSVYYTLRESDRREIYATKCMKYLTFLDYITIEATGKNIEAKLSEKEKEIQMLRQRDSMNRDAIASLSDQLDKVMQEIKILKKQR
jgi:integrase